MTKMMTRMTINMQHGVKLYVDNLGVVRTVYVDGKQFNATFVSIEHNINELPKLTIEIYVDSLEYVHPTQNIKIEEGEES